MLKHSKSWDRSPDFWTCEDHSQNHMPSNISLQMPSDIIPAFNKKKDTKYGRNMANGGHYEDTTSETVNLISVNEDDDEDDEVEEDNTSAGIKWPPLTEHRKLIFYQWTGLSKKPSFLKKMRKGNNEEKKALASKVKKDKIQQTKTEDSFPGVSHRKTSRLHHVMESFKRKRSKTAANNAISCQVVGGLPESRQSLEWTKEESVRTYFMQNILELSDQLPMEETSQLENKSEYLHLLAMDDQHQAAQELEKRNRPISSEIDHMQLYQKKSLGLEGDHSDQLYIVNEDMNEDLQFVDGLQNPSSYLTCIQESAADVSILQDMDSYSQDKDPSSAVIPSSAFVEAPSLVGELPLTGSLERECCCTGNLMKEITEAQNRQDFLENEYLKLISRYNSDNNIMIELLQEQHRRYSQLLVNVNDLQEQQNAEILTMKDVILFMEEKMAYQSYERARDIWDELGIFQNRLSKMEAEQKQQNSWASATEANCRQMLYSKAVNLLTIIATKTSQVFRGKVMNWLPVIAILICLSTVSVHVTPFITTHLYSTLVIVALLYGVFHNGNKGSVNLPRSRLVGHVTSLFHRMTNRYNFMSKFVEAWELYFGG